MSTRYYFVIERATDLPKTDTFGGSDPVVQVSCAGVTFGGTKVIENTRNPVWKHAMCCENDSDKDITFTLGDKDGNKIELVGTALLNGKNFKQGSDVSLPFKFKKDKFNKKNGDARLHIRMVGMMKSGKTIKHELDQYKVPHLYEKGKKHNEYYFTVPCPQLGPTVHLRVELEDDGVDIKMLSTDPTFQCYLDMTYALSKKSTTLKRDEYNKPKKMGENFMVSETVKLDDIDPAFDPRQLTLLAFDRTTITETDLATIVKKCGWAGAMGYRACKEKLKGCMFDDKEEEVVFPIENCPDLRLIVDFDKGNVDCKISFLETCPPDIAAVMSIKGVDCKKKSKIYTTPHKYCGGKLTHMRETQLDDIPYGSSLNAMKMHLIQVSNPRSVCLHDVISLK